MTDQKRPTIQLAEIVFGEGGANPDGTRYSVNHDPPKLVVHPGVVIPVNEDGNELSDEEYAELVAFLERKEKQE